MFMRTDFKFHQYYHQFFPQINIIIKKEKQSGNSLRIHISSVRNLKRGIRINYFYIQKEILFYKSFL